MVRSKQPGAKRETSSEYSNKETANWEGTDGRAAANGKTVAVNGKDIEETKEAGVLQLVTAVAGIYASL